MDQEVDTSSDRLVGGMGRDGRRHRIMHRRSSRNAERAAGILDQTARSQRRRPLMRERKPDLAMMDMQMPRMDGLEVLNAVERDWIGVR